MDSTRVCRRCGWTLKDEDVTCPSCGTWNVREEDTLEGMEKKEKQQQEAE